MPSFCLEFALDYFEGVGGAAQTAPREVPYRRRLAVTATAHVAPHDVRLSAQ